MKLVEDFDEVYDLKKERKLGRVSKKKDGKKGCVLRVFRFCTIYMPKVIQLSRKTKFYYIRSNCLVQTKLSTVRNLYEFPKQVELFDFILKIRFETIACKPEN